MKILEYEPSLFPKQDIVKVLQEVNAFYRPTLETRILNKSNLNSFEEYLDKVLTHGHVFIAQENAEIAGLVIFYANDTVKSKGFIPLVAIRENFQGRGLGKLLMTETLKTIKKNGMQKVLINTWSQNVRAISLYKNLGFVPVLENTDEIKMKIIL